MATEREIVEEELATLLQQEADYLATNKFFEMYPDDGKYARDRYVKQMQFFKLGATFQQRCFMGQIGQ